MPKSVSRVRFGSSLNSRVPLTIKTFVVLNVRPTIISKIPKLQLKQSLLLVFLQKNSNPSKGLTPDNNFRGKFKNFIKEMERAEDLRSILNIFCNT